MRWAWRWCWSDLQYRYFTLVKFISKVSSYFFSQKLFLIRSMWERRYTISWRHQTLWRTSRDLQWFPLGNYLWWFLWWSRCHGGLCTVRILQIQWDPNITFLFHIVFHELLLQLDATSFSSAVYGPGTGPIFLRNVACTGTETQLSDCTSLPNNAICNHNEDASILCSAQCKAYNT